jgi:signal transduction histidine kinase
MRLEYAEREVILSVSDDGIGIPAEDMQHLFERFHRGRNASSYPGNGLGLAIVKAIVEEHAGQVEAKSAGPGQGSTFIIRLPLS